MKNIFTSFLALLLLSVPLRAQTLDTAFALPNVNVYNFLWGTTSQGDTLISGSSFNGDLVRLLKNGTLLNTIDLPASITFNQGMVFDGTNFLIVSGFISAGARLFTIDRNGQQVGTFRTFPAGIGGNSGGIGGLAFDAATNSIWFGVYSPDFATYPNAYAYKWNLTSNAITDTVPLYTRQVQGIALKGDTLFYAADNFQGDAERIYAVNLRSPNKDTLFSFPLPDPDNDQDPRGLYWDNDLQRLWVIAWRVGTNINAFRNFYRYRIGGGSPKIAFSTSALNFSNVAVDSTIQQTVTVSNTGSATLRLTGITSTDPNFTFQAIVPDSIPSGSSRAVQIRFRPTQYGADSAVIRVASNDFTEPNKPIRAQGFGVFSGRRLALSDTTYNFGQRRTNSRSGWNFLLRNLGTEPLRIDSILPSRQNAAFYLDTTLLRFPVQIDTGRSLALRYWFNPNQTGNFSATGSVFSNAGNGTLQTVSLSGQGATVNRQLGQIFWQTTIPANPNTSSTDRKTTVMRSIPDVNNDGVADVVVCTDNYWTLCYNGSSSFDGDLLWAFSTDMETGVVNFNVGAVNRVAAMQIAPDLNGDGISDVVIGCGGGNEEVYAISGRTGRRLWAWALQDTVNFSLGDINAIDVQNDFNGDGTVDVLATSSATDQAGFEGRRSVYCINGRSGQILWQLPLNTFVDGVTWTPQGGVAATNVQGNANNLMRGFNAAGTQTWSYNNNRAVWAMTSLMNGAQRLIILAEGTAVLGATVSVKALDAVSGALVWTGATESGFYTDVRTTRDMNGDGVPDVIAAGANNLVFLSGATGQALWQQSLGSITLGVAELRQGTKTIGGVSNAVGATTLDNRVIFFNAQNGTSLFSYSFGSGGNSTAAEKISVIDDITSDGTVDIVAASRDGRVVCLSGGDNPMSVSAMTAAKPSRFALEQNYPNPFNPSTGIRYQVAAVSDVRLEVFDMLGRKVATLVNMRQGAGQYTVRFDGAALSSGVYFYTLRAGSFSETRKMMLVK
jgi:hypothetical protein